MLGVLTSSLLPLLCIGFSFLAALIAVNKVRKNKTGKRSPIVHDSLRAPGEYLQKRIMKLDDDINETLTFLIITPLVVFAMYTAQLQFSTTPPSLLVEIMCFIAVIVVIFSLANKLSRLLQDRLNYQLGLDAERAVGQELNLLMLHGFHVFHDFPEKRNNIDHIVIGPSGVFAVETKGRTKPDKKRGKKDATVIYKQGQLIFPDNIYDVDYAKQAKKQAASLSKWLTSAVGEPVPVRPALALPGWFVDPQEPDEVVLLYGQKNNYLKALNGKRMLSDTLIQRIVHQISEKCRDVTPRAYSEPKKQ